MKSKTKSCKTCGKKQKQRQTKPSVEEKDAKKMTAFVICGLLLTAGLMAQSSYKLYSLPIFVLILTPRTIFIVAISCFFLRKNMYAIIKYLEFLLSPFYFCMFFAFFFSATINEEIKLDSSQEISVFFALFCFCYALHLLAATIKCFTEK